MIFPQALQLRRRLARGTLLLGLLLAPWERAHPAAEESRQPEVIRLPQAPEVAVPQSAPRAPSRAGVNMSVQEALAQLWQRRRTYLEKNDLTAARRQVDLMRDVVRREGILSAEDIAGAFLLEGNRALESGNRARALESFHLATEFSPDEPAAYIGVARTLWSQEKDWGGALSSMLRAVQASLHNPVSRTARIGNLLLVLLLGSVTAAALWCILSALRTARLIQHD